MTVAAARRAGKSLPLKTPAKTASDPSVPPLSRSKSLSNEVDLSLNDCKLWLEQASTSCAHWIKSFFDCSACVCPPWPGTIAHRKTLILLAVKMDIVR